MPRDQIFISYSHHDKRWLDELKVTLAPLLRRRKIIAWDDTKIGIGTKWKAEIKSALERANIAVLLVSRWFLASEFIASNELPSLLETAQKGGLVIIWIAVGYSLYEETEITDYQAANDPARPLNSLSESEVDRELVRIAKFLASQISDREPGKEPAKGTGPSLTLYFDDFLLDEQGIDPKARFRWPSGLRDPGGVKLDIEGDGKKKTDDEIVQEIVDGLSEPKVGEVSVSPAHQRLRKELANGRWAWRSVNALSGKAGIDEQKALELLQGDPQVVLGRAKSGRTIARLTDI